jgi:hypothetical protein
MSRGKKSKTFDLKGTVKSIANRFGYDIVRTSISCPNNLDFLNLAIGAAIPDDDNFFFVQVWVPMMESAPIPCTRSWCLAIYKGSWWSLFQISSRNFVGTMPPRVS